MANITMNRNNGHAQAYVTKVSCSLCRQEMASHSVNVDGKVIDYVIKCETEGCDNYEVLFYEAITTLARYPSAS